MHVLLIWMLGTALACAMPIAMVSLYLWLRQRKKRRPRCKGLGPHRD